LGDVNLNNTLYVNKSTGNVGIGTTGPGEKLDISGTLRTTSYNTAPASGAGVEMEYYASTGYLTTYDRSGGTYQPMIIRGSTLQFGNGASPNQLYINSISGNVGIGTTAPNSTLHVVGIVNATQGFAYGLSAARPAAKEGVVWWNVSAGFHCPQWYNSTHWICNTGAATRADPV